MDEDIKPVIVDESDFYDALCEVHALKNNLNSLCREVSKALNKLEDLVIRVENESVANGTDEPTGLVRKIIEIKSKVCDIRPNINYHISRAQQNSQQLRFLCENLRRQAEGKRDNI